MTKSILTKATHGSTFSVAATVVAISLSVARAILLMRYLEPEQFGIVALAVLLSAATLPVATMGLDRALIRETDPTPSTFSTHFVLRITLAATLTVLALMARPLLRMAFSGLVVDTFLILLGVNLLATLGATHGAVLHRQMRFASISLLTTVANVATFIIAVSLAAGGAGIWSLIAEQATAPLFRAFVLRIYLRPWKGGFAFDCQIARRLAGFGRHLLSAQILAILLRRFDDFWVGTSLGNTPLGYYSRAYRLAQYPELAFGAPVVQVFFPAFSLLASQPVELAKAFLRSNGFLIRIGCLAAVSLAAIAPELTVFLLTEHWLPIVPLFRLMLIFTIASPVYDNLSSFVIAMGHPAAVTRIRVGQLVIFVPLVIWFADLWSANGVALATNIMMLVGLALLFRRCRGLVRFSFRELFLWPGVSSLFGLLGWALVRDAIPALPTPARLLIKLLVVASLFCLVLLAAERHRLRSYLRPFLRSIRRRSVTRQTASSTRRPPSAPDGPRP